MEGRRIALLVATDSYQDTSLSRLTAPASDARKLAAVLRDTRISGFEVTRLYNRPHYIVGREIGNLYRDRRSSDLTLLYFSGHGVKDESGHLYLAMTDTDHENLQFTAVQAEQIRAAMEGCRSRQNVLILDCCYAGAFPSGFGVKGDTVVHALEQLGGRGSVVLTSSDAMQLSFEGNQVTQTGPAPPRSAPGSLFTRFLIEGLRTGRADLDGDGDITHDELYSYVHDRVIEEQPQQRPKKEEDVEGRICFARNVHWALPSRIANAISIPYASGKLSALQELRGLHNVGNAIVKQRVLETVRTLAEDDSKEVSEAAKQFLSEILPEKHSSAQFDATETAEPPAAERPSAPPRRSPSGPPSNRPSAPPGRSPSSRLHRLGQAIAGSRLRGGDTRKRWLWAAGAVLVVAAVVVVLILKPWMTSQPSSTEIAATLHTYFDAINARNYRLAWSQFSPSNQSDNPYDGFVRGESTTTIRNLQLHGIASGPLAGTYIASVTFRSYQNPSKAPNHSESCDDWTLDYTMIQGSGGWLIDGANPQPGVPAHQNC